ncbi:hypothetical protein DVH05_009236 [Phytophthora capsici]|nr:hypothetical protein DVH05_009236 [Phytophthora capsici]
MRTRQAVRDSDSNSSMASPAIAIAPTPSPKAATKKRTRRQCSQPDCTKVDAGGGFCVAHGGGKKCSFPGCTKGYQTGGFCRRHGGGARCQVAGCTKVDAGKGLCRAHGGGKRCQITGCPKADVGGGFCTAHGGGKRCSEPGCTKIDQGGGKCRAHGGARRCRRRNCQQPARGASGLCSEHGGSRVCSVLSCRRLVRSPNDNGTMCATCTRSQKQRLAVDQTQMRANDSAASDHSNESPRNSAIPTPEGSGASVLASLPPMSPASANARCDGSQVANCLDNGCARSFGGNCNCVADCTCNSPTSLSMPRMVPMLTSSNTVTSVATSTTQLASKEFQPFLRRLKLSTPKTMPLPRFVLQIKPHSSLGINAIVAMLGTMPGVRSVHPIPEKPAQVSSSDTKTASGNEGTPSACLVTLRGERSLDLEMVLAPLRNLQLAEINVIEQSSIPWTRKEVVLHVPDMMCPGNCGSSVLNAVRTVEGVEAARLRFENRQVVIRGDLDVDTVQAAVTDIGFGSTVNSEVPLPRRYRFRVNDLSDVGLTGAKLKDALKSLEGVENLVLLPDRVEILVIAMLLDSAPLVEAAKCVGYEMLELSEESWGIPMEVAPPSGGSSNRITSPSTREYHECDMSICPQNGCPRYMTTVAHTAALAVGWAVPGCGMSSGGECTCGDSCKCEGCPEHNPVS